MSKVSIIQKITPAFWGHPEAAGGPFQHMFNFRRLWKLSVSLMLIVTLVPLISITLIDYNMTQKSFESEILLRTARIVSNAKRNISFFLDERKSALDFLVHDNTFDRLNDETHLAIVLDNLKKGFGGGFEDLGVIDGAGRQKTYVGPYNLKGKDYSGQPWFLEVVESGIYISGIFLGYRNIPHMIIAVKYDLPDGSFYVLRSALDTARFNLQLSHLELSGRGDAFLINREGVLQTPTRHFGKEFGKFSLPVPPYADSTQVFETQDPEGTRLIVGYAYIPETPFILIVAKVENELMKPWRQTRFRLIGFLVASITLILLAIFGVATYLVNNLYMADQKRLMSLHEVEYTSKMASIGRLAAGIAHEINNPLAIINEKAGLMKDMFTYKKEYADDPKLMRVISSIIASVDRCATITKRLLGFARQPDVRIQQINLQDIIHEVISFTGKEAEYRSIDIIVNAADGLPELESDRGKMQQVLLNLINNAFAALEDGGRLDISASLNKDDTVHISITDNGCGIPASDIDRVFEPFFSTKTQKGGTGLGLSITYNLVHEIGGKIEVHSEENMGTCFMLTLPLKIAKNKEGRMTSRENNARR